MPIVATIPHQSTKKNRLASHDALGAHPLRGRRSGIATARHAGDGCCCCCSVAIQGPLGVGEEDGVGGDGKQHC